MRIAFLAFLAFCSCSFPGHIRMQTLKNNVQVATTVYRRSSFYTVRAEFLNKNSNSVRLLMKCFWHDDSGVLGEPVAVKLALQPKGKGMKRFSVGKPFALETKLMQLECKYFDLDILEAAQKRASANYWRQRRTHP